MAGPVVSFRDVRFSFGERSVLGPLSLDVMEGERLVLLGASGSGKTTALRLVNALLSPSSGEIRVLDRSTSEWDVVRLRRSIGYVIQEVGLLPHFSVAQNAGLVPRLEGWESDRVDRQVETLLKLVGLDPAEFGDRRPHELSGGQRQRVGVARALAAEPPIMLCDEPFGALDPITRAELQREFKQLADRLRKTVIFVTHDVREALLLGTRIAVLEGGNLKFVGTPDEFRNSMDPRVQALRDLT